MTELTIEFVTLDCLAGRRPTRWYAPESVVERQAGERDAVFDWLKARTEELRHGGRAVSRLRFRQRRHMWAARISYHKTPILE